MPLPYEVAVSRGDVMRRLADLDRAVRELAAARRLESSSVGAGALTIKAAGGLRVLHDNGQPMLEVGFRDTIFGPVEELVCYRRTGTISLQIQSNLLGPEFIRVLDSVGNLLFGDDGPTGQGLAAPYLPGQFHSMATPPDSTASGTFTMLQKAIWQKQHPQAVFWVRSVVTATTGEIRFRIATGPDAGTVVGGPATISGTATASYGPFAIPGAHLGEFELDIEGRVASGAGSVAVRVMAAVGRQT